MTAPDHVRRTDPATALGAGLVATLEGYPDAVAIVRPRRGRSGPVRDLAIVIANAAYRAASGAAPGSGSSAASAGGTVLPDHAAAVRELLGEPAGVRAATRREVAGQRPDGSTGVTELTLVPAGPMVAIVARDITAHRTAADELAAAERHARQSAGRLAILAEHATDALLMVTPTGIVTWASGATTSLIGLAAGVDLWAMWPALLHPDDVAIFDGVGARLRAGTTIVETARMRTATGGHRWFRIRLIPLPDGDDRYVSLVVGMEEIDELETTRRALARSEERFRLAMSSSAVGMAITARDGRFQEVNPALCALLGRDADALRSTGWQGLTHPDDLAADEAVRAALLAGSTDTARRTTRYLRPDGRTVWADVSVAAIRDADGIVRSYITQMVDVTAAREVELRAEQWRRELAEAQRVARVGSWTLDLATGERTWSDELIRIWGYDPDAPLPPASVTDRGIPDDARSAIEAGRRRAIETGRGWAVEHELRRPDGTTRSVVSTGEAVRDAGGAIVGLRGAVIDATERRRVRDTKLRRLEHQLDHVARIEHTMRTRIAVVNGWAEILGDLDPSTRLAACRDAIDAIARNGGELESLLTGMLDAARAASRADSVELAPVALDTVVAPIVHDYAALHDGVRLGSSVERGIAVIGFREGIDTILRHLVENALRHGGEGVMIEVGARPLPDGRVEIAVLDDGPGFPPGEDVFAAFGRRDGGPGHGLGLHVVRTLAEAMGGEVEARSGPGGRGAEVVIRLESAAGR